MPGHTMQHEVCAFALPGELARPQQTATLRGKLTRLLTCFVGKARRYGLALSVAGELMVRFDDGVNFLA